MVGSHLEQDQNVGGATYIFSVSLTLLITKMSITTAC